MHGTNPTNGTFIPQYNFNCTASGIPPPQCAPGVVYGPADIEAPTGPSPDDIYQFRGLAAPLPVTLVKFDASLANGNAVNVSWTTSEEINSSYFVVERSADATSWQPIGQVSAKGNSSGLVDYKYVDPSPTNATNFYRLRMVDLDAKYKFSRVAKVSLEAKVAALIVFNNPFHDQIRIKVDLSSAELLELRLTDISGRTYTQQSVKAVPGANYFNINSALGGNGMYILTVKGQSYNQTVKLLKE